ncbi:MAG TPA: lysylphosphatidylglycerol synthase domain-containing protein [Xanthobacteraceae bacterium]|nr:lysylphosphatidylglycerol synthase domain-containing protein [Xanthobacteraceae bacterium]
MNPRAIVQYLRERVGWQAVGIALSILIIAGASYVLYHLLSDIEPRQVYAALRRTPTYALVLAGIFVAFGYITLTFYDYFALRSINREDIPYSTAALASFTSYAIGHNVGFSVFSGGAVRYRIYSVNGLDAVEVAKICFIAGLTFWLGNVAFLGLGLIVDPYAANAIDKLPTFANRWLGAAALLALLGYVVWVSTAPRSIGVGSERWHVTLPGGRLTLIQIALGILDLSCASAAMYMLMPAAPQIDFLSLSVIFVTATLLGFASHSPGGLGVFDAAMLIALMHFDRQSLIRFGKENVLGALLLFRLYYYIVPFALSLAILGVREFILDLKPVAAKLEQKVFRRPSARRPTAASRRKK